MSSDVGIRVWRQYGTRRVFAKIDSICCVYDERFQTHAPVRAVPYFALSDMRSCRREKFHELSAREFELILEFAKKAVAEVRLDASSQRTPTRPR